MSKTIVLKPRLNEKTYGLAASRVYVFDVDRSANRTSIARAVEAQFEVKVTKVNTANINGKAKRVISISGKRLRSGEGRRNDFKKAYVTLAEGHGLPFFDAIEEEAQQEQTAQEKIDKAVAKQTEKDQKSAAKTAKPAKQSAKAKAVKSETADTAEKSSSDDASKRSAWRGFRRRKDSDNNGSAK